MSSVCISCGICKARNLICGDIVAALISGGKINTYTDSVEAEKKLVEIRKIDMNAFLIRKYIPEMMASYNQGYDSDVPF
jgi:hypothetical protein